MTTDSSGIVLLDKPVGQTSFQSLGILKTRLGTRRVGHAGTLDRFAEGLLVVLVGRATRLVPFASGMDKDYTASILFGQETDTLDPEGDVIAEGPVPALADLEAVLPSFTGAIWQVPPAYSAVHVDGVRAHEATRRGEKVEIAPRQVTIHRLALVDYDPPRATIEVTCSKGTYIRALARDIARKLSTRAHLARLRRTRIGAFRVEEAVPPEQFEPARHLIAPTRIFERAPGVQLLRLREEWSRKAGQGLPVRDCFFTEPPRSDGTIAAIGSTGELVAVIEKRGNRYRYAAAFPKEESL